VLIALYSAVRQVASLGRRFFWVADISKPDMALAMLVAALTGANVALGSQPETSAAQNRVITVMLPIGVTSFALRRMAAGVGVYWGLSSLFGVVQAVIVRRRVAARTA
jgi:membrane protein insertase Oxa1/YidC/SpoIIIJ